MRTGLERGILARISLVIGLLGFAWIEPAHAAIDMTGEWSLVASPTPIMATLEVVQSGGTLTADLAFSGGPFFSGVGSIAPNGAFDLNFGPHQAVE